MSSDVLQPGAGADVTSGGPSNVATDSFPLKPGLLVGGRYRIERKLAESGMGVIYLASDRQLLSRPVAIKLMLDRLFALPMMKDRFFHEAEALTRLDHPGVVTVLGMGELLDSQPYLVMQYVDGKSLRAMVPRGGMDLELMGRLIRQLGRALTAVHAGGILHRDIKPENIMVQRLPAGDIHCKLIDFGLARVENTVHPAPEASHVSGGTPSYMAPELYLGSSPSESSDIYALGVVAYEMACGQLPFTGSSPHASRFQEMEFPPSVVAIRPGFPAEASSRIQEALSRDPGARPRSVKDFTEPLARLLNEAAEQGGVPPAQPPERRASTAVDPQAKTLPPSSLTSLEAGPEGRSTTLLPEALESADPQAVSRQAPPAAPSPAPVSPAPVSPAPVSPAPVSPDPASRVLAPHSIVILAPDCTRLQVRLAEQVAEALSSEGHQVALETGDRHDIASARRANARIKAADVIFVLLSQEALGDEALREELRQALELSQRGGKPRLVAARLGLLDPIPEPMAFVLGAMEQLPRREELDARFLLEEFKAALGSTGERAAARPRSESFDGAIPLDNEFYIPRASDELFSAAISRRASIVLVKGARQMGKTSLLVRALDRARQEGSRIVWVDFQKYNAADLESSELLLLALIDALSEQLGIDVDINKVWSSRRGANQNFERFFRREIFGRISEQVVFGMDEVDRLFGTVVGNDLFGLFRSWHNDRASDTNAPWKRLTLAIAYSTEPHLFITNLNQSPFNVGEHVHLEDFKINEVADLNRRYGSQLSSAMALERFVRLLGGHPFLIHRGLFTLLDQQMDVGQLEIIADQDKGPFGAHLWRYLQILGRTPELVESLQVLLRKKSPPSLEHFCRLRSSGILQGDAPREATFRCHLYERYLRKHLL